MNACMFDYWRACRVLVCACEGAWGLVCAGMLIAAGTPTTHIEVVEVLAEVDEVRERVQFVVIERQTRQLMLHDETTR